MDYRELTAETIKLRIREEVPSHETGLPGEILRLGKMRQDQISELTARLKESEADRAARLEVIRGLEGIVTGLQALVDEEKQRAADYERGWQALEGTFVVRQGRRIGLINTGRYEKCSQTAIDD